MVRRFFVLLILLAVPFTACADSTAGTGSRVCTAANPTAGPSGACSVSHFLVADYGDGYINNSTTGVYSPKDAQWLNYVQVCNTSSSYRNDYTVYKQNGVKMGCYAFALAVIGGTSPQNPYYTDLGGSGSSVTVQSSVGFGHACNGDLMVDVEGGGNWLMVNWTNAQAAQAFTQAYINNPPKINTGFDYWYLDGSPFISNYYDAVTGGSAVPCLPNGQNATQSTWDAAETSIFQSLNTVPLINDARGLADFVGVSPWIGERGENTYLESGSPIRLASPYWEQYGANGELTMAYNHMMYIMQQDDAGVLPTSTQGMGDRMYALASFLLTYDLGSTYYWFGANGFSRDTDPNNPSGERIMPEEWFVPENPVVPEPSPQTGVGALKDSGTGAYVREYQDCYYQGYRIGRCVIVVNTTTATENWPSSLASYQCANTCHQMVMHNGSGSNSLYCTVTQGQPCLGAEIEDGGYLTFDGPPAPTSIPATTGVIVVDTSR
jgi:hypothetical protein